MSAVEGGVYAVHLLFAGLWTGSVLFVTWAVLPTAADGTSSAGTLSAITGRLKTVSRTSAVFLLLTGGYLAGVKYGGGALTSTTKGYLVIAMIVLWLALGGLVEVGASRLADGFDQQKVREPARQARPFFYAASVVAVLLLIDAGAIVGF
ncbi:MAG: CopD family protein [Haloarculaceae archaeon]